MSILGRVLMVMHLDKGDTRFVFREHDNGMSRSMLQRGPKYKWETVEHHEFLSKDTVLTRYGHPKEQKMIYYLVWIEDGKVKEVLSYEDEQSRDKYVEYFKVHHQNRTYVKHDEVK